MIDWTQGPARERLLARDPKSLRERLDREDLILLDRPLPGSNRSGTVVVDGRRRRPLYFDGRFLTASDLTREQAYFLGRQADLGRAGGFGVVRGLQVNPVSSATSLQINPGHGVTPSGELVVISEHVEIDLANVATIQRLDVAFGLAPIPSPPTRTRTGLFVVALRPVEFTANPIASYPTTIAGPRSVEDGDIVEATAVTLIPYPDDGARTEPNMRRARAAHEIFVAGSRRGLPADVLPLALIALDLGTVTWIDQYLVRREVGAEHGDVLGLGFAPRATREAHALQYDHHLQEVLQQRLADRRGWSFSASEHFFSLPPAGRMPAASIDGTSFTQSFFPPTVDVELSFVAEDEIRVLIEEGLLLPPIDLTLADDALESTSVLVLIPATRPEIRQLRNTLATAGASPLLRPLLPAAAPNLVASRRPIESLRRLRLPLPAQLIAVPSPDALRDNAWRQALRADALLWYVRRRNLNVRADVVGEAAQAPGDDRAVDLVLRANLERLGIFGRWQDLRMQATPAAIEAAAAALGSEKVRRSALLTRLTFDKLEQHGEELDKVTAIRVTGELDRNQELGEGLVRIEAAHPELTRPDATLPDEATILRLDRLGRVVNDEARLGALAGEVVAIAATDNPARAARLDAVDAAIDSLGAREARGSTTVREAVLGRLDTIRTLDEAGAKQVADSLRRPATGVPRFGAGLERIERIDPAAATPDLVKALVDAGAVDDFDRLGARESDTTALANLTREVTALARGDDQEKHEKIRTLLTERLERLGR